MRERVGLVPQEDNLDPDLTVRQNLDVYGRYFGIPAATVSERVPKLLDFMQLGERGDAKVMQLSGGLKRRLVIARALIAEPSLVVLDEPTTGLDPQARVLIWRRLLDLKRDGKTLLLTTHYMDEAQRLCDRIVIIDGGKVLDEGTPQELIDRHVRGHVFEVAKPLPDGFVEDGLERNDIGDAVLYYVADPLEVQRRLPPSRRVSAGAARQPGGRVPASDRAPPARRSLTCTARDMQHSPSTATARRCGAAISRSGAS